MRSDFSFELAGKEIHIWTFPINATDDVVARLQRVLDAEEVQRAARFRFNHPRESFVVAHGVLRYLLGRYLKAHPSEVRFVYGSKGKPALALQSNIEFNLTHSGGLAVIALTLDREIGVDVEQIRSMPDREGIANRFFCVEEASEILALPQAERERAFYCCWTRKEAYIKAIGDGLSTPLDEFRVTVQPDALARFVHIAHDAGAAVAWMLHDLRLDPGYAAALAYRDRERPLCLQRIVDVGEFIGVCDSA